jgi:hypothetical protein
MNVTAEKDRATSIDCEEFRDILAMKIKDLAVDRCLLFLKRWKKREGDDESFTI